MRVLGFCLSLLGIVWASPAVAQDTLTFEDGSVLHGRIKRLSQGELVLDVPIADGDVYVDWARVTRVDSQRLFQFVTDEGQRFLGRIRLETDPGTETVVIDVGG